MGTYAIAVICAIVVSSVFMFLIFHRTKLLNFRVLLSVTIASLISAITLPGIFNTISANKSGDTEFKTLLAIMIISIAIYIFLSFILSMVISRIIGRADKKETTESNRKEALTAESEPKWMAAIAAAESAGQPEPSVSAEAGAELKDTNTTEIPAKIEMEMKQEDTVNYLEQIYDNMMHDKGEEAANNVEYVYEDENNSEKSVDSTKNIDKMGIENEVQENENLTIDECIEKAFGLKEQGDGEGAILYYMYALDKKPQKELAFSIVLDICVIYKTLGQGELAYEILNSYNDAFGDIMEDSVRKEIEYNLSSI